MPMNTTVTNTNIAPLDRTNSTLKTNSSTVSNAQDSGFQPETQVELESSIKNMLSSLEKAAIGKGMSKAGIPEEVQKMVDNLLKNAFSLDSSLGKGLGDVLQSQKFTLDQLNSLAKLLDQIGVLVEGNSLGKLPESLKTLLTNLQLLGGEGGKFLDEVTLNKLSFQLLEGKDIKQLPELLQFLIMQNSMGTANSALQPSGMNFLKQLIQYFMPSPSQGDAAENNQAGKPAQNQPNQGNVTNQPPQPGTAQNQQSGNKPSNQLPAANLGNNQASPTNTNTRPAANNTAQSVPPGGQNQASPTNPNIRPAANNTAQSAPPGGQNQASPTNPNTGSAANNTAQSAPPGGQNQASPTNPNTGSAANNPAQSASPGGQNQASPTNPNTGPAANNPAQSAPPGGQNQASPTNPNTGPAANNTAQSAPPGGQNQALPTNPNANTAANANLSRPPQNQMNLPPRLGQTILPTNDQLTGDKANQTATRPALSVGQSGLQNTPQTLQTLKNLAGQLMRQPTLSETEVSLLRNFVNGTQKVLADVEVKQLQTLISMSEASLPASVRQAAIRQNLPDLPKLWAFVQLCNLTRLLDLPANRLRKSSKNISDFATALKNSMQNENEVTGNQRSMSFMTPLYLGDNEKCYPTYIHVYDEVADNGKDGAGKKETWLRLCLLTENIGAVELVFQLYDQDNVNVRVAFSAQAAVDSFNEYIPKLKTAFEDLPLVLNDIKVSAIGE